ncbi:PHP domain-containing protein, partial [Paracoccus sp. (in: a-proteobacteria)]|uniref:PHP domain-containing protein n=1 Tax=Paracoccus sp. TaxID=267 RepID=UPI0026DFAB69
MPPAYAELGARSNFSLLHGASHPAELVLTARALGHAGLGICDSNSLAGIVRGHVAAREAGLPYVVGARLVLDDGSAFLVWPTDRASYGRLTGLLSRGRMRSPKGECQIRRDEMAEHAREWCLATIPPRQPDPDFASRFAALARQLRGHLALPLFCAAACYLDGHDQERMAWLDDTVRRAGGGAALL